jgi:LacI family sucrose operon transcriptional repressor
MKKKNVTFSDIAQYTGFSKTTISRYFNNPDSITLENQKTIADALVALDYKENKVARILASGKTEFVGIIIPNLYMHYYSEMLNRILSTYQKFGYKFLVFVGNEEKDVERQYISELLAYQIEGMIILSHTISSKELAQYNIPIVTVEREDKYVCSVNCDNYMGGVQAASLLEKSNCDILIHINGNVPKSIPSSARIDGFRDICEEHNIPYELFLRELGNTYTENTENITKIIDEIEEKYPHKRKGVFLSNDTHANIFLNLIIRKFGKLPDEYKIVGFDNSSISSEAIIPISTVGQQIDVIANEAMQLLVMQMNERKKRVPHILKEPIHKVVTPELIRRKTT